MGREAELLFLVEFPIGEYSYKAQCSLVVPPIVEVTSVVSTVSELRPGLTPVPVAFDGSGRDVRDFSGSHQLSRVSSQWT